MLQHLFCAHKIKDPWKQKANEKSTYSMPKEGENTEKSSKTTSDL